MRVYEQRRDIESNVAALKKLNKSIGFVPTMGALHSGHMALVEQALKENDVVIVSIFVNPTQFNNNEDLLKYPRTLESDISTLSDFTSEIIVFVPNTNEIYGEHLISLKYNFDGLENEMEGKFRQGHFDGVGTVLKYLFEIVSPTNAYFGEKDFQQLQIVRKLVKIEKLPIQIIGCSIYREKNGLALSSRNKRLSKKQLEEAPLIYSVLKQVKKDFGTKNVDVLTEWVSNQFLNSEEFKLEYFVIAETSDLKPIKEKQKNKVYRAFIAAYAGKIRLIDNIALN